MAKKDNDYFNPEFFYARPKMEELPSDNAKAVYAYWLSKCKGDEVPQRADLDLLDLAPYLANIAIYRKENAEYKFTYIGRKIEEHMAMRRFTGRLFSELDNSRAILARTDWLVENKAPYFIQDQPLVWSSDRSFTLYSVLALPLADKNGGVKFILSLNEFSN